MSGEGWLALGLLAFAIVLFVTEWLRVDVVGLLVLSALALTGLVNPQEALAGFSSPAVVTVWAMFILSAGLTRTGIAHRLGQPLQRFTKRSEAMLIAALMVAASLLSALINTVTVTAILLPATMELSRRSGRPASRLLMPLALGCLLGGPFTGISTPPNILVTDALRAAGLRPFGIFEFTPITAAIVLSGVVFVVLVGRRLLTASDAGVGDDARRLLAASYQLDTHIFAIRIPRTSPLSGRTLSESRLGSALHLTVLALQRKGLLTLALRPGEVLQAEDLLIVHGHPDHLRRFHVRQHLQTEPIDPFHDLVPLQFGDALLVYGQRSNLEVLAQDPDFIVLDEAAARAPRLEKASVAAAIMVAVLLSAILGFVPIAIAGLSGAALMILFGCLSMEEAYRAIEWKVVFLIAGMLPLGAAIENTGVAQMGAAALIAAVGDLGTRWVVAALFMVTVLATQIVPTAALVVLMAPVALGTAGTLGVSPHLLMMTVAIAASSSFASPLSHPAHLLVMGPGGYRFTDYLKVGVPLTLVIFCVSVWLLPILWPP